MSADIRCSHAGWEINTSQQPNNMKVTGRHTIIYYGVAAYSLFFKKEKRLYFTFKVPLLCFADTPFFQSPADLDFIAVHKDLFMSIFCVSSQIVASETQHRCTIAGAVNYGNYNIKFNPLCRISPDDFTEQSSSCVNHESGWRNMNQKTKKWLHGSHSIYHKVSNIWI